MITSRFLAGIHLRIGLVGMTRGSSTVLTSKDNAMRIFFLVGLASVLFFGSLSAQQPSADKDPWASCRFLIGEWTGEGTGSPGQGKGGFSLAEDLHGKILLRRSRADYPAAGGRPAIS